MSVIKCPCGFCEYTSNLRSNGKKIYSEFGDFAWEDGLGYVIDYCSRCGAKLHLEGTTGRTYDELEDENVELKRMVEWYLSTNGHCNNCTDMNTCGDKEPCMSCKYHDGDKDNFTPAPVPDDFIGGN